MTRIARQQYRDILKERRSLIKQCDRAKYAHAKRARLERELRDATLAALRIEISGRAAA